MKNTESFQPGQLVKLIGTFGEDLTGEIVGPWEVENWSKVSTPEGVFTWPNSQLEALTPLDQEKK